MGFVTKYGVRRPTQPDARIGRPMCTVRRAVRPDACIRRPI